MAVSWVYRPPPREPGHLLSGASDAGSAFTIIWSFLRLKEPFPDRFDLDRRTRRNPLFRGCHSVGRQEDEFLAARGFPRFVERPVLPRNRLGLVQARADLDELLDLALVADQKVDFVVGPGERRLSRLFKTKLVPGCLESVGRELTFAGELHQRGPGDAFRVDAEVTTEHGAHVAESEAIRPEREESIWEPS